MEESKFTSKNALVVVEVTVAILTAALAVYAGFVNSALSRINDSVYKTESRMATEVKRLQTEIDTITRDQKLTIEKLHVEYCGIQKSLADINVAVTALNSRLISRDDVEKIARREATIYHQACEASKIKDKK
jgi:cell division protein FtsL